MADLQVFFLQGCPVNQVKRIVEEMRIDSCLQQPELKVLDLVSRMKLFTEQRGNFLSHIIKASRQVPNFVLSIFKAGTREPIGADRSHMVLELLDAGGQGRSCIDDDRNRHGKQEQCYPCHLLPVW